MWHCESSALAVNVVIVFTPAVLPWLCVQLGNLFGKKPTVVDNEPALTFDLDAMVEAVYSMGGDVVAKVDVRKKLQQQSAAQ